jgi:hypothetical protein
MDNEKITDIASYEFPMKKLATLKDVDFGNGTHFLRVTLREQRRFTIFDIDPVSAAKFGQQLVDWAKLQNTEE